MKKIAYYSVPILALIIFVFVMNSGGYFKRPKGEDENVRPCKYSSNWST